MVRLRNKGGEPGGSPPLWATLPLGGFARGDLVASRGVDVEGPNDGDSLKEVRERLLDLGVSRGRRKMEAAARCPLNFVPLPICPRTAHNQTVTDRGNVVKNLFVGNLGSEVTPEELRRLFEAYGQVGQVHIVRDRDTGLPRGFAFVEMKNEADAEKAIKALNCSILRDCALNVSYARPRPERPAA